jgi:hypothetical protein
MVQRMFSFLAYDDRLQPQPFVETMEDKCQPASWPGCLAQLGAVKEEPTKVPSSTGDGW